MSNNVSAQTPKSSKPKDAAKAFEKSHLEAIVANAPAHSKAMVTGAYHALGVAALKESDQATLDEAGASHFDEAGEPVKKKKPPVKQATGMTVHDLKSGHKLSAAGIAAHAAKASTPEDFKENSEFHNDFSLTVHWEIARTRFVAHGHKNPGLLLYYFKGRWEKTSARAKRAGCDWLFDSAPSLATCAGLTFNEFRTAWPKLRKIGEAEGWLVAGKKKGGGYEDRVNKIFWRFIPERYPTRLEIEQDPNWRVFLHWCRTGERQKIIGVFKGEKTWAS
jgi:hypothetical protein